MNSPRKIKWLLIDIGDVLLLKSTHQKFGALLAEELGIDVELAQQINVAHFTTMDAKFIPEGDFVATLAQDLEYHAPANIYTYFEQAYKKQVRANSELLTFLKEIRAAGVQTAVLSNTIAIYQGIQKELGITKESGFDPILYSWEVELLKPHKEIFELAVERLQASPEEIIFIDDKTGHLHGAEQVGMQTILFESTEATIAKIKEMTTAS